jgi:uncharacterized membrane protein YbhN (UPF0104 family)
VSKTLRLLASVALLAWLAWRTDWAQVADAFARLQAGLWLAGVALYALTQLVSSLRWALLARPLGFAQPLRHFVGYYYVGMFFNLVLPTSVGGDVVRAWYLDGGSGRRLPAFLSVLVDRGSGLLVLLALACLAVVFCPVPLPPWLPWSVGGLGAAAALGTALLLAAAPRWRPAPPEATGRGWRARLAALPGAVAQLRAAYLPRPGLLLGTTLLSVVVQVANVALVWLIGRALGVPVPASYYWVLVPVVTLLTLLPVSLNGMGVREGGTVLLLAPLGVAPAAALSLAFLWFASFTVVSLAGVGFYLFGRFPRFEVRPDDEPVRGHPHQGRAGQLKGAA